MRGMTDTIIRKKITGEAGNPGEFGHRARADDLGVNLAEPVPAATLLTGYGAEPQLLADTFTHNEVEELVEGFERYLASDTADDQFYRAAVIPIDKVWAKGEPVEMQSHHMGGAIDAEQEYIDAIATAYRGGEEIHPVVVHLAADGRYEWIDGQHRITAALRAGNATINALVRLDSDEQLTELETRLGWSASAASTIA